MPSDIKTIENSGAAPIKVWLEPWAEHVEIPAHSVAEFRATSDIDGKLEVILGEAPAVYGWAGSSLSVMVASKMIWESYAAAPALSEKMSMRDFIHTLFGGEK